MLDPYIVYDQIVVTNDEAVTGPKNVFWLFSVLLEGM
jgi:hypothetical protein